MEADARLRAKYPAMGTLDEFEQWLAPKVRSFQRDGGARAVTTIPIIFHIIHDGEAVGSGDNIGSVYVNAQIQQLNNDFRRILNSSGYNSDAVGADAEIEFCAALVDASGNPLAEAGINRIDRNGKGWTAPPYGSCTADDDFDDTYIENTIKPQSQWDPNKYLNVWVMDIDCGILGYAQFPNSSGLSGMGNNNGPASTDGVVLLSTSIGSTEVPFPGGEPYNEGRTGTHEIGHFFGLRHIWGDTECGTDYCADTPQAEGPASGCPNSTTCDGVQDMVENYMDYSYDACMNIFTIDQKARMQTVLLNSPRRGVLANSTACAGGTSNPGCTATINTFPYTEGFESGLGAWGQSTADDFDWIRISGATPSGTTGPSAAAAGSWYVYLESSSPNYPSKVSILTSPCFDLSAAAGATFTFKYHLYGATTMGGLQLQAMTGGGSWESLWSVSGNQGNSWETATIDLAAYTGGTVQLRLLGTTGTTWQGDMGVDDISLTATSEGNNSSGCTNGIATFPYAESWETGFGAWSQDNTDDFDWLRITGATPSGNTGPGAAIDQIWYAYIESSSPNYSNLSAILNGPCYDLTEAAEATFTFQYHMYGASNMGGITLQARPQDGNWTTIWTRTGNQGSYWHGASVGLNSYVGSTVELRFIGTTGTTWQGDMAIDDLKLAIDGGSTATCTNIVLSITFDNYPEETSWQITDAAGSVVASGGPYGSQADGSTVNLTGCFPDGCYTLSMLDRYGDGMCCTYGNGSYSLKDSNGNVLASGSSYGSSENTNFCLPYSSNRENTLVSSDVPKNTLETFPNPARDRLTMVYESKAEGQVHWRIIDLLGKTVRSATWQIEAGSNQQILDVQQLPAGTYILELEHNGRPQLQRFIVNR